MLKRARSWLVAGLADRAGGLDRADLLDAYARLHPIEIATAVEVIEMRADRDSREGR